MEPMSVSLPRRAMPTSPLVWGCLFEIYGQGPRGLILASEEITLSTPASSLPVRPVKAKSLPEGPDLASNTDGSPESHYKGDDRLLDIGQPVIRDRGFLLGRDPDCGML